jgi:drug/metabolite transporter (DMT)-like permease
MTLSRPDLEVSRMNWLVFALMTVVSWGLYGVFLHTGQLGMADPVNGRYKAFLFVGLAYFLTAVLAPLAILKLQGAAWTFPAKGALWSLIAGTVGAIGAFCVLLAFGAKGTPSVVMTIVFAGAPIVNAITSMVLHPPAGGWGSIRWQFVVGLLLAVVGAGMVTLYKPAPGPAKAARAEGASSAVSAR